jgi:hypothetical protein
VTSRYCLEGLGGVKGAGTGSEDLTTHRDADDRYRGDNSNRKDNSDTPD